MIISLPNYQNTKQPANKLRNNHLSLALAASPSNNPLLQPQPISYNLFRTTTSRPLTHHKHNSPMPPRTPHPSPLPVPTTWITKPWPVKCILSETYTSYLIQWAGCDPETGTLWLPTWVCSPLLSLFPLLPTSPLFPLTRTRSV